VHRFLIAVALQAIFS